VKKTNKLYASLLDKVNKEHASEHQTRVKNLLAILCAILVKETVNLNKLKNQLGTILGKEATQADSHYKRLTRFFADSFNQHSLWKAILKAVLHLLVQHIDKRGGGKYLLLDATCWQFGKVKIQLLCLSILYQGVAIPIMWVNLSKKGHSNFDERKRLLQMASLLHELKGMTLLADREYIGRKWFTYLTKAGINWLIRLPIEDYKHEISAGKKAYSSLLKQARKGKTVSQQVVIEGNLYQFVAFRNLQASEAKEELVLLLTSLQVNKKRVAAIYRLRWEIESMFKHLKSNGFHLEDLSMMQEKKIRLMVALLVAAYIVCVCEGIKKLKSIRTRTSTQGKQTRYESIFRKGYTQVSNYMQRIELFLVFLLTVLGKPIRILKPT
jgi:hypothetical protein